jgi:FMN phosphatase YigB (HAD superfamily)
MSQGAMKPIKALFLDLNETLVDGSGGRDVITSTCRDIAAQTGLDADRLFETNSEVWRNYWPTVEDRWTLGPLDGETVSLEAWRRTLRAFGRDDESLVRLARETHSRHSRETLRLFDDVRELFALLQTRLPFAVITNGASDTQRDALRV